MIFFASANLSNQLVQFTSQVHYFCPVIVDSLCFNACSTLCELNIEQILPLLLAINTVSNRWPASERNDEKPTAQEIQVCWM